MCTRCSDFPVFIFKLSLVLFLLTEPCIFLCISKMKGARTFLKMKTGSENLVHILLHCYINILYQDSPLNNQKKILNQKQNSPDMKIMKIVPYSGSEIFITKCFEMHIPTSHTLIQFCALEQNGNIHIFSM